MLGDAPAGQVSDLAFAVTSCNRSNSRYNPLPFEIRAILVYEFARRLSAKDPPRALRVFLLALTCMTYDTTRCADPAALKAVNAWGMLVTTDLRFALTNSTPASQAVAARAALVDEAAMVDGCSSFSALWRVLLPAVKPGLITVGLFAFLASWNDFFAPLILITDSRLQTLPLAVANLRGKVQGIVDYGATEAGVVVLALPCIVLFLILQRHYVRGFLSGAFKG